MTLRKSSGGTEAGPSQVRSRAWNKRFPFPPSLVKYSCLAGLDGSFFREGLQLEACAICFQAQGIMNHLGGELCTDFTAQETDGFFWEVT